MPLWQLLPIGFLLSLVLTMGLNELSLLPWRRAKELHWSEQARILWPIKQGAVVQIWALPIALACTGIIWCGIHLTEAGYLLGVGLVGTLAGTWPFDHSVTPRLPFRSWVRNVLVSWSITLARYFVIIGLAWMMPAQWGPQTWIVGAIAAAILLIWPYAILTLPRLTGEFREPGPRLQQIVQACAEKQNVRVRSCWRTPALVANAWAVPLSGQLIFTDRIIEILDDEELAAICHHELGHLKEPKGVIAARNLLSLTALAWVFFRPLAHLWHFKGMDGAVLSGILTVVIIFNFQTYARRLLMAMLRSLEKRADAVAMEGAASKGVYANALLKLNEANLVPAVISSRGQSHPNSYDRVIKAGVTPDFPRPRPADNLNWLGLLWIITLGATGALALNAVQTQHAPSHTPPSARAQGSSP